MKIYVDESGQDTAGRLFIVALAVFDKEQAVFEQKLINFEAASGKHTKKWQKTRKGERLRYIQAVLSSKFFKNKLYFADFKNAGQEYLPLIVYSISKLALSKRRSVKEKVAVTIDALTRAERKKVGADLRKFGLMTGKIRGKKDDSSPLLRLADALAGFVRDGLEKQGDYVELFNKSLKDGVIRRID